MSGKCYLFFWYLTTVTVQRGSTCAPVELLSTKLKQAEKRMVDGRLTLNMVKSEAGSSTIPSCPGQNVSATVIRSQLGQTATFRCTVPECDTNSAACKDAVVGLRWLHRGYSVWRVLNNQSNHTCPFNYSVSTGTTVSHLFIHNITIGAAGSAQCVRKGLPGNESRYFAHGKYCVVTVYVMIPFIKASDLFASRSQRVTAEAGRTVTLRCDLQFSLKDYAVYRYIWRYNGQIAMAPDFHPLSGLMKPVLPYESRFEYNETYTTLTLRNAPKSLSGRYECWVMPYFEVDEWLVNVIHLLIK